MTTRTVLTDFNAERTVATVRLNRPEKLNGVTWHMLREMRQVQRALRREKKLRVVVLEGAGTSFCAGLDFKSALASPFTVLKMYLQIWLPWRNVFQSWAMGWRDLPVPVIARVQGHCFGAGLQLVLGADIRVCTLDACISVMESKWGLVPDMGGVALLAELLPLDVAKELVLTGRVIEGAQAAELGVMTHASELPDAVVHGLVAEILERSPDAVAAGKRLLQRVWGPDASEHLAQERRWQRKLVGFKNQRISLHRHAGGKSVPFVKSRIK
ncbi:MAG: crotonase/enoyl-CoA hydratase family protein [Limnobacter sp.]|nr:crotonase/enoyl-CoA hydratase family protein [Limnobacter sp.]